MSKYRLGRLRGVYVSIHHDETGKRHRHTLGTDNKVAAQAAIDKLNAQAEREPGQTVETLWEAYRKAHAGRRIAESMETTWKALKGTFATREAETIGDATVESYIALRRTPTERFPNGRADGTIWTELNHLRIVLSWALLKQRISKVPHIALPPKPAPRNRWLTRDEVNRLKNSATGPHTRLFVILAIATGGRKEAILQLKWDQVDFDRRIIHLDDQQATVRRKGRASVPMNKTVLAALRVARKEALSDYVIEWNGKPVKSVKRSLAKTAEKAKVHGVSAHVFRHSAAVWQAEAGISMAKIAQYLGHSDSRITETVYARYAPSHMQDAADVLDLETSGVPTGSDVPAPVNERRTDA